MEYVWITGPSAIGKATLAHLLAEVSNSPLRHRLGVADAVQLLGYPGTLEELSARETSKSGLIIWQAKNDPLIDKITTWNPLAKQCIILVWRPLESHLVGYKEKRLRCYPEGFSEETSDEEWLAALRHDRATNFATVSNHSALGITIVDASSEYAILGELPND